MKKIEQNISISDLDSWGSVTDLGSQLLSGDGAVCGKFTLGTPEEAIHAAYFGVSKSKFKMTYPFTEQAIVLVGSATLTNEESGESLTFNEGDCWVVEKGSKIIWEIHSANFIKHYLAAV